MKNFHEYRQHEMERRMGDNLPLDVLIVGGTGAGKSSLVNAFFGESDKSQSLPEPI